MNNLSVTLINFVLMEEAEPEDFEVYLLICKDGRMSAGVIQPEPIINRVYFVKAVVECGKKKIFMPFYRLKTNTLIFNLSPIRFGFLRYLRFLCIAGSAVCQGTYSITMIPLVILL